MAKIDEIPFDWEAFQKMGQDAVKVAESLLKIKVPKTIKDAVDGNFMEAGSELSEKILGHTPSGEMQEWKKRTIRLDVSNKILRDYEEAVVKSFILSSGGVLRNIFDGIMWLPNFITLYLGDFLFLIQPLIWAGLKKFGELVEIERQLKNITASLKKEQELLSKLYAIVPDSPAEAADIRKEIQDSYDHTAELEGDAEMLIKMEREATSFLELAVIALSVVIAFLSVEKLLDVAGSSTAAAVALKPVRDLRDAAILEIKTKSLPQRRGKRFRVRKRSRRN